MISIYSFNKYFLSAYHVPGTTGAVDRAVNPNQPNQPKPIPAFMEAFI